MIDRRVARLLVPCILVSAAFASARAGSRTTVALAGVDESARKLGMPAIALEVSGSPAPDARAVATELARGLDKLVYTRALREGEPADYVLRVTLGARLSDGSTITIPFEAALAAASGAPVWKVEGRTEVDGAPVAPADLVAIGRNVLAALVHDGWVQPRYDPDDPPPAAPQIRRD